MPPTVKKAPVESPQPSVASMSAFQAFTGLHLHENPEISEALEFFVRGYIGCAIAEGLGCVPPSCADQALTMFAHHDSWGHTGFPWDRLDRNWKISAMNKLIYHVHNGHSLAEQPMDDFSVLVHPQAAKSGGRARPSIGKEGDGSGFLCKQGGASVYDDEDDEKYDTPGHPVAPLLMKSKTTTASRTGQITLPIPRLLDLPYELPFSSSSESPLQRMTLERMGNNGSATIASSSSPLSSLPSGIFKTHLAARTFTDRRQTRSVTRTATSRNSTPRSAISVASSHQSTRLQKNKQKKQQPAKPTGERLWSFETTLDSRVKGEDVEYKIKWTKGKPTWQPSLDLRDAPEELDTFHEKYPEKAGPPDWFARGRAKAEVMDGSDSL